MKSVLDYPSEKSHIFTAPRFLFLGESIHGVSEFYSLKKEIANSYFRKPAVLIFEADSSGMVLSHQLREDASPASAPETGFPGIWNEYGPPGGQDGGQSGRTRPGERLGLLVLGRTK